MTAPWLEENGPVLDLVGEAVRKPAFCLPLVRPREEATLIEAMTFGEIQRMRSFIRMLQARANFRIGTGDIDGAIDDLVTCERLGRHVQRQRTVVMRLVGIAIESIAASVGVAAIRESQPTKEQLERLVDEHNALPPLPNMDRMRLAERYYMLDPLQAVAVGNESLAELFSVWAGIDEFRLRFATYISLDWNIVMRRINAVYDGTGKPHIFPPPSLLSLSNLFIGARSRRMADCVAGICTPAFQAIRAAIGRLNCVDNLCRIAPGQTTYSVVVGGSTAFQAAQGKSLGDLGTNLMLVEREQSVCWMDPTPELVEAIACKGINRQEEGVIGIGSPHPGLVNVGFRDGSAQMISATIPLPLLQGLLDGTAVDRPY